jgi:thioredoxin reductase (NADPH)
MADKPVESVIIVGSGPAGYTAALYTARANLAPLVVEGFAWGGLLQQTTEVENYPGFPEGVMGPELMQRFREQPERFGARLITAQAERIALADEPGGVHSVWVGDEEHRARAVILAMGAVHKKLGVPGEDELGGRGVSYCATCDAAFFRGAHAIVVGGGDSAMEEAIFLSKFAGKVTIVHRREQFRASKIMLARAKEQQNIELLTPYTVSEFITGENGTLTRAILHRVAAGEGQAPTGEDRAARQAASPRPADGRLGLEVSAAFVAIGHEPQSELAAGQLELDAEGYVTVSGRSTKTNRPGVFAAGDLVDRTYRQAVTAAGSGCQAALDAEWYLRDTPQIPDTELPSALRERELAEAQWAPAASRA